MQQIYVRRDFYDEQIQAFSDLCFAGSFPAALQLYFLHSPVQESVENTTEEQQEDPSLSVEPVIGESTEAPVAAPMMARANAPVAYSAPSVDTERYEWLDMSFTSNCNSYSIDLYTTKNAGTIHEENQNVGGDFDFTEGIGFRTYKAVPNNPNEWVFDSWKTNVYFDGWGLYKPIEDDNIQGPANKWAFSMRGYDTSKYDGSDADVQLNAILPTAGIVIGHPLYYTLCANFNPLVTVTTDGNGTVTAELTQHEDKYEVEYGNSATFTITPNDGYKVASVTADGIVIPVDENGKCTLPSVTEPTTLKVEFEKAEDEDTITKDKIDGAVIVTVACDNLPEHTHQYSLSVNGTDDGEYPNYKITKTSDESAILHLLKDGWLHTFVSQPGHEGHSLVDSSSNYINIKLTFDEASGEWKLPENAKQHDVTINVKCTSEIPEPDDSIISQLKVALNCVNVTDGSHNDTSELSTYTTGYYTCEVDKVNRTATVSITEDQAKYWINNNINTMVGKEQHSFVSVSDPITLTYKNGQWKVPEDDNAKKIVIKMLCGPSIAQLNDQLNVKMVCDNNGVHSGNNEQFSREYDILADSYHLDMYSVGGEYRCDVTIDAPQYLSKFDQDTNATHVLMSSDNKRTLYYTEDGNWLIVPDEEKTVTFNVSCKPDINFPNPPDKETVLGLIGDVTIQCTTASSGHGQNKYSLTKDDIDFENVVPVQMTAGDEIQFTLPVTIKNAAALQSGFLANYNTLTGKTHIWSSGSIPASITLTYDSVTKAWANKDVNGIVLSVYCTTGGGTIDPNPNPGGGGDNDDDDDRYTGDNTVTRTINDDDVPLNDRPNNTTTIDDEDVPLADLPDDTVTIDDGEVPLKANPSTGDSLPFAAMAAAALSLGGVIVLNRKKK